MAASSAHILLPHLALWLLDGAEQWQRRGGDDDRAVRDHGDSASGVWTVV
jgi:hypothetical protein